MALLISDLIGDRAQRASDARALIFRDQTLTYGALASLVTACANGLLALGVERGARVAVYLPKQLETVAALFAAAQAGLVFVPVNPVLKARQVQHILQDSAARILITSPERLALLTPHLRESPQLRHLVLVGDSSVATLDGATPIQRWQDLLLAPLRASHRVVDRDMAAILYTSGSTGSPKGVVLSHANLLAGARSVAAYLQNTSADCLLAALPLSFDYGLSQLTTAFHAGASVVLLEHLFARDVIAAVAAEGVTGLAAVPPLWLQLAEQAWPAAAVRSLRYVTNSGGVMPRHTLDRLRLLLPKTSVFLMYGLTEAFRATYLPPEELDRRPDSIGKAIPNAEVLVVRPDGSICDDDEPGELVQRGAHVALGYWNAPEATQQRFRPAPGSPPELSAPEIAVWSGDTVRRDAEGYLYFIGRVDEMIKSSGYRVSPTEIEEILLASGEVIEAVAFGAPHPMLGQAIVAVATPRNPAAAPETALEFCRRQLPTYMTPLRIDYRASLPRNANGKYDRAQLRQEYRDCFAGPT